MIVNPAAGRGRARRMLPVLQRTLDRVLGGQRPYALQLTTGPGEERILARAAAEAGAETILALGGDGTWGNVARGILASGRSTRLALLAAGTGNDLAYAAALPVHDVGAAVAIACGDGERRIDAGEADGLHFVNCLGFGFDAEVVGATRQVRWLRGHAVYLLTAARMLVGYRGFAATLTLGGGASTPAIDGGPAATRESRHLLIAVANGPRFGGGFLIAPGASIDDGTLDVVRIADGGAWRRLALFGMARSGTHVDAPEVSRQRAQALTLVFPAPPLIQADGELHHAQDRSVTVRCLPGALRLAVPSQADASRPRG